MNLNPKTTAFLFPGQGSQAVGMGKELAEAYPVAKGLFDEADALFGFSLSKLMWEGPKEELDETVNTQPALYVHSIAAYRTFRDAAIFTNKRLIVRDAQGLTGKKVEIYSLPYSSIFMWSSENGHGIFNFNSEIELWTKAGHIKVNLAKGIDVRRLDKLIAEAVLTGSHHSQ